MEGVVSDFGNHTAICPWGLLSEASAIRDDLQPAGQGCWKVWGPLQGLAVAAMASETITTNTGIKSL